MGWLVERAKERHRNLGSGQAIAARLWKQAPAGGLGSEGALANNLRKLDRGEMIDWWLDQRGEPYLTALAALLTWSVPELRRNIEAARPADDDASRWFEFEVFPRLRRLDLDEEDPFPGVPYELLAGDGPRVPTWWHAPPGAGRTLVARWLVRRHGWVLASGPGPWPERAFLEATSDDIAGRRPGRVVVASPRPTAQLGWQVVATPAGWERELIAWVAERIQPGGALRRREVEEALAAGRLAVGTPGQLIELLAEVDAFGIGVLDHSIPASEALHGWIQLHAARPDRAVGEASRRHLREHGVRLLPAIEMARRARGLPVTADALHACMPPLPPPPSADAIYEVARGGGVEAVLAYVQPTAAALVEAMRGLRWVVPEGWGFPTRVLQHLQACVVDLGANAPDFHTLGALLDQPELAEDLLWALSEPGVLETWLARVAAAAVDDPETILALDGLGKAVALRVARGSPAPREGLAALRMKIAQVGGPDERFPDLALRVRVAAEDGWGPLAWLVLDERLGAGEPPGPRGWTLALEVDLRLVKRRDDPPGRAAPLLRRLGVDVLDRLVAANPDEGRWLSPCHVRATLNEPDAVQLAHDLAGIGPFDVVEHLFRRWAPTLEDVARKLWPAWHAYRGYPLQSADVASLSCVWSVFPFDDLTWEEAEALRRQVPLGVEVPDTVWSALLERVPGDEGLLARAPIDVLLAWAERSRHGGIGRGAAWWRAPDRVAARVSKLLLGDPHGRLEGWMDAAPPEASRAVLGAVAGGVGDHARPVVRAWRARVIAARSEGWREVWRDLEGLSRE